MKVQLIICSKYELATSIIILDHENTTDMKTHIKQYLNEFYEIDQLIKIVTNNKNEVP